MKTIEKARTAAAAPKAAATMQALVYHGPGKRAWETRPRPKLQQPTDAILRIATTTICGTDLHVLKGDVPEVAPGRVLGHEGVGVVVETGPGVARFKAGDRALISCITSCAVCDSCRRGMPSHCEQGGWLLGHAVDGTHAEYVRVPLADSSLHHAPPSADVAALAMLSDVFPTGYECGVLAGRVKPGDAVAIVGAGPIGMAALMASQLFSPGQVIVVDPDAWRLNAARAFGATQCVEAEGPEAVETIKWLTSGRGVDVAIEAVGSPEAFDICQGAVAPGGVVANVGLHGRPVSLHLERLWSSNVTITTRLVDAVSTPLLLKTAAAGRLQPGKLVTHRFPLSRMMEAYDVFGAAQKANALKVVLEAGEGL